MIDFSRCPLPPFQHQREGARLLVDRPVFALFDEQGVGKTFQVITAACALFEQKVIDKVLVVTPAAVRGVWADHELGELKKHLWLDIPAKITEFHSRCRTWLHGPDDARRLEFMVVNFEFVRPKARLLQLKPFCTAKTLLVIDEATAVKSHNAQQTKAVVQLRRACGRVVALTGTPITNSIGDLYSIGNILDPRILECKTYYHFRARYAIMGGYRLGGRPVQIIGWQNIADVQRRFAPYVIRRLKKDVLDLPPKLASIALTATLTPETWKLYQSMKNDLVAWLSASTVSVAAQAVVKVMRLQQLTSGFLGGIEDSGIDDEQSERPVTGTQEVGKEKLNLILAWIAERLEEDPCFRLVIWARFRLELRRLAEEIQSQHPNALIGVISGGQKREEREHALRLLDPRTASPSKPTIVVGNPASGGLGISLVAANTVLYASNSHSVMQRLQSEDRTARPGQTLPCSYYDVIAEGPNGQRTVDHAVIKALRKNEDVAAWTTAAWVKVLEEE